MLVAVAEMDATVQMLFYGAAVVFFVMGAVGYSWGKISLVSAGLACFAFPTFWHALAVS